MEYQEERNLGNIANPREGEARSQFQLADTLQQWGKFGKQRYQEQMAQNAVEEAGAVDPTLEAPEKRSAATMVGRIYNKVVTQGHYAAVRNNYRGEVKALTQVHKNDLPKLNREVADLKKETLNMVDPEVRSQTSVDFDAFYNPIVEQLSTAKMVADAQESLKNIAGAAKGFMDDSIRNFHDGDYEQAQYNKERFMTFVEEVREIDPGEADAMAAEYDYKVKEQAAFADYKMARAEGQGDQYIAELINDPPEQLSLEQAADVVDYLESQRTTLNRAETEQRAMVEEANSKTIADFYVATQQGMLNTDDFVKRRDELLAAELITPEKYASLTNQFIQAQEKRTKQAQDQIEEQQKIRMESDWVNTTLEGGIPLDDDGLPVTVTQSMVDDHYDMNYFANDQVTMEAKTQYAKQAIQQGYLPKTYQKELSQMVNTGDPVQIAAAADIVDSLRTDQFGFTNDVLPKRLEAFMDSVVEKVDMGIEGTEAVELARSETDPANSARLEGIKAQIKDSDLEEDYAEEVREMFKTGFLQSASIEPVEYQLTSQYKSLVETYMLNDRMSMDGAKKKARQIMQASWGSFDGYAMKFPPNVMPQYRVEHDPDGTYIRRQLEESMGETVNGLDVGGYFMTAIPGRTMPDGGPIYKVTAITEDGMIDIDNEWVPDRAAEVKRRKQEVMELMEKERESGFARTRASIDAAREGQTPLTDREVFESLDMPVRETTGKIMESAGEAYDKYNVPLKDIIEDFEFTKGRRRTR